MAHHRVTKNIGRRLNESRAGRPNAITEYETSITVHGDLRGIGDNLQNIIVGTMCMGGEMSR